MTTYMTLIGILLAVALIYLMFRKGGGCCGGHGHEEHTKSGHAGHGETGPHHGPHHLQTGENIDPVCKMSVGGSEIFSGHDGRKYYFCSDHCRKTFDNDPDQFISKAA